MAEVIGGPQSPKQLLEDVMAAVASADIAELQKLRQEFLSIPENFSKCVDTNGNTISHVAVQKDTATLEYLVAHYHVDVNVVNLHGKTPLHTAVTLNYVAACQFLLAHGAKEDMSTHAQSTPFHSAAACGSVECLEVLLQHAAGPSNDDRKRREKLDEADRNRCTALHKCAFDGGLRVAKWLVEKGATVDCKDIHETTPLLVAAKMARADICTMLIARGADVKHADDKGNTVAHYAASRCLEGIFDLALQHNASPRDANAEFNTPLHLACMHPHPELAGWDQIVFAILRACRNTVPDVRDVKNVAGKKPLDYLPRELLDRVTYDYLDAQDAARAVELAAKEAAAKKASEKKHQLLGEKRSAIEDRERALREEAERLQREADDRVRAEEDARIRMDEEAEAKRLEEEEARKKKEGKGGGGGKGGKGGKK